jgi:peptide/nickel transport system substrate-binding protein
MPLRRDTEHTFLSVLKKSAIGIVLLRFFLCCPAVFAGDMAEASRYGGTLVLSTTSDPKSFNPVLAKETSTTEITSLIFEGLTRTDPFDLTAKPNLAERWEVSVDGRTWTFFLRRDVRWADGVPFTADDVVFTFNDLIFNDAVPNSARDIFTISGQPLEVSKVDAFTVRFILPTKFAPFLTSMGESILPKHALLASVKAGKFAFTWGIDTPVKRIIGTGAFMLSEYKPGQRVVFVPNPLYWKKSKGGGQLPYLGKIIYLVVPSVEVELLKFMEGTIDAYGVRGTDYPLLKPLESKGHFKIHDMGPDMGSSFVVFNQNPGENEKTKKPYVQAYKQKWFSNVHFRRAVAYAIDKKRIIDIVKNGLGYPQYSPLSPAIGLFYCKDVRQYDLDLKKAGEELALAGFMDPDKDGVLEDKDGHELEFSLYTNADNNERAETAAIVRQDLENLGMKVNLQFLEFNTLVGKLTSTFDWEAIVLGLTGSSDPHFGQNVWLSSGQLHLWNPKQASPATSWEKRVDELFAAGVQELDEKKRKVYYDEYQKIIADEVPVAYTVLGARLTAVRERFGNLKPAIFGGVFHNLEEIYLLPTGKGGGL